MIRVDDVRYSYGVEPALVGVTADVRPGRVLGLIGPNGSGKTTLLRAMSGSLRPDHGRVTLDGTSLAEINQRDLARRVAVVSQDAVAELPFIVAELVMLGRNVHRRSFERYRREDRQIAGEALRRVGAHQFAARPFAALSGGERQRVLIARALAQQADHLLLDEPTNHLDVRYQHEVLQLVGTLDLTTVVVLHDLNLAARYCDDLLLLDRGRVVAHGVPDAVLVPDTLQPVYGVRVARRTDDDELTLSFRPFAVDVDWT